MSGCCSTKQHTEGTGNTGHGAGCHSGHTAGHGTSSCCGHDHGHGGAVASEAGVSASSALPEAGADCCGHDHAHGGASSGSAGTLAAAAFTRLVSPSATEAGHASQGNAVTADACGCSCCDAPPVEFTRLSAPRAVSRAVPRAVSDGVRTPIRIMQMDCPVEEGLIRAKLEGMPGVKRLEFNLVQRVLTVEHDPAALDHIAEAIRSLGFLPELPDAQGRLAEEEETHKPWWPLGLAVTAAAAAEVVHWTALPHWLGLVFALLAIALCGLGTYRKGFVALRHLNLNINALMSIAVTGAMLLGQWPEAAMVMVLFTIAEKVEARSLDRARNAIAGLLRLAPDRATVQREDGSWQEVEASAIAVGSMVRVRPGERIALDGEVVRGHSTVNQAPITGESIPVDKAPGDRVFAGTVNEAGAFEYRVTAGAEDTALARIIHAVEQAQGVKAPTQRFIDRFAKVYTPMVFAGALLVAVVTPLLAGGGWQEWIYKALVLLVIACPCALVISTPVSIVSGLAAAARKGILIKGGVYLEEGRKLSWIALDKTGTITNGKPVQTDMEWLDGTDAAHARGIAAGLAALSDHPVSEAIAYAAQADGVAPAHVDGFEALPGRGVRGTAGGIVYLLGNRRLVEEHGTLPPMVAERFEALERQGRSVVALMGAERILGLFAVADTVKETSRAAIEDLHRLGVRTVMLSGDNAHIVEAVAAQVGMDRAFGEMLPEGKLQAVEALGKEGRVGMVGDGINDAPALARADIGFAMGAMGTDTAIETADVALMDDDLRKLPAFVRLSRATRHILVQNIVLALGIKGVFLALTLAGLGTMWMAVFADVGSSLLVVANGLRLLRA